MERVIVTGATGMIGSTMIEQMVKDGIEVTAIVRPSSNKMNNLIQNKNVHIIECDIRNLLSLKDKLQQTYDAFYHFAWDGTYGDSRNDAKLQEINIKVTLDAVELAHYFGCSVFVGAGSQAEFGKVEGRISDKLPKNPETGYGIAKLTACKLSKILCDAYNIRHNWGRIVSTYGPKDNKYTMIASSIIGMLNHERLSFTKGDQIWDYVYSEDCAKAFYLIGHSGVNGKAYTIGSGKTMHLKEFVLTMRDAIDASLEIGLGELAYYPNQAMYLEADITELSEDTGFYPEYDFSKGIEKTIKWCEEEIKHGVTF